MSGDDPLGKRSLYSGAPRPGRVATLECSSCGATTHLTPLELARAHLPVWAWLPIRRHAHLLRCPACERRTWVRLRPAR